MKFEFINFKILNLNSIFFLKFQQSLLLLTILLFLGQVSVQVDGVKTLQNIIHHLIILHKIHTSVRLAGYTEVYEPEDSDVDQ